MVNRPIEFPSQLKWKLFSKLAFGEDKVQSIFKLQKENCGLYFKSNGLVTGEVAPQGSILWPLRYILHANELLDIISQNVVFYAADTSMIIHQ